MAEYKPCRYCGEKPKAYKPAKDEPKHFLIDHWCSVQQGKVFIGSEAGLGDIVRFWNEVQDGK